MDSTIELGIRNFYGPGPIPHIQTISRTNDVHVCRLLFAKFREVEEKNVAGHDGVVARFVWLVPAV